MSWLMADAVNNAQAMQFLIPPYNKLSSNQSNLPENSRIHQTFPSTLYLLFPHLFIIYPKTKMTSNNNLTVTAIDLGSSSAKIAAVLKGGIEILTNQANFRQTPNIVAFGPNQRLIGESGQLKIKSNSPNTVTAPSRFLAFNHDCNYLKNELKFCPAKTHPTQNQHSSLKFNLLYDDKRSGFTAEQLVAAYLTEMQKIIAHTNNLSNKNLVITVPPYFTQHERLALMDAVEICKKQLNNEYTTQLVNEQIAVSMDYGYAKRNEFSEDMQKAHKVLFVDFGHSKTNLFVTAFNKQHMRVVAEKFDRRLGCKFLDEELLKFYANHFDSTHPNVQLNLMESKKAVIKLFQSIEKERKVLSGNLDHELNIECLLQDEDLSYSMKREQYEKICEPVINKFKNLLQNFYEELQQKGICFDVIELIGGGTRIPAVIRAISEVFATEPSRTINSSECVAKGAALISAMNSSIFKVQPYSYFTISPYSIQLMINGQASGKYLIERNQLLLKEKQVQLEFATLPSDFALTAEYSTDQIQNGLEKKVFECRVGVQSEMTQNTNENQQMKEELQEKQTKFIVRISFDHSGLLKLNSIKPFDKKIALKTTNINYFPKFSSEQLAQMQKQQKQMTLWDFKIKKFYEKKNQFESLIYKNRHIIQSILAQNPQHVSQHKANQLNSFIDIQQNWLSSLDITSNAKIDDFAHKEKQMNQKVEQFAALVNQIKESHLLFNSELQKLADLLNEIVSKRNPDMYPDDVNKVGQWINEVFEKQKSFPNSQPPVVSPNQIKQVREELIQKIKDFDMEMERQRQVNMRRGRSTQGGFYRPSESSYHPGRDHEADYFKPRSTRNRPHQTSSNPFGSFFGKNFF